MNVSEPSQVIQPSIPDCGQSNEQSAPMLSGPTVDAAIRKHLADVMTWLREPDWTDEASLEWLMDWVNRRPIAALGMVAMLMPNSVSEDRS